MCLLDIIKQNGFVLWQDANLNHSNFVYIWANSVAALGVGRSSNNASNMRVNPILSKKKIASIKDAGKSFIAAFVSKLTHENVKLYVKIDHSSKISGNASTLELEMKKY